MINVCICGGGNLAHAFAGMLSLNPYVSKLTVLTRRPKKWNHKLKILKDANEIISGIFHVTDDFSVLTQADVIILTLPCHVRYLYLLKIKQYVSAKTLLLAAPSIGGINFVFENIFPDNPFVCCQRVPYICRIIEYGNSVKVDIKKSIDIYYSNNLLPKHKKIVANILNMQLSEISSFWPLLLSNSNPIIHIARLCEILTTHYPCLTPPLFYEEWGDFASKLAVDMDAELGKVMKKLNVTEYKSLLRHYEVSDYKNLTKKIRSIPAFSNITTPMQKINNFFILDNQSRYLIEDLILGTCVIKQIASLLKITTPFIDYAISLMQRVLNKNLINKQGILDLCEWESCLEKGYYDIVFNKSIIKILNSITPASRKCGS